MNFVVQSIYHEQQQYDKILSILDKVPTTIQTRLIEKLGNK